MSARTINNPGVEINEIDRSGYGKVDNSLPNAPASLMFGFSDKGKDLSFEWINSKTTLDETFGKPTTEFESYFYNAAIEILNRGGTCIASRLPYSNNQYNKYNYVDYDASELIYMNRQKIDVNDNFQIIKDIQDSLSIILDELNIQQFNIDNIIGMANATQYLVDEILDNTDDQTTISTINDIADNLKKFINEYTTLDPRFSLLYMNDSNLTSYLEIKMDTSPSGKGYGSNTDISVLDDCLTGRKPPQLKNKIRIYDITRGKYDKLLNCECISSTTLSAWTNECLGIVPMVVTAPNAMFFQNLLHNVDANYLSTGVGSSIVSSDVYNPVSSFVTIQNDTICQALDDTSKYMSIPLASTSLFNEPLINVDSLSRRASQQFPQINFYDVTHFDKTYLKQVGIIVLKAFRDTGNNGKLSFQLLEAFVGSLDKNARDNITNANIYIDNIVNEQSNYIRVFSNVDMKLIQEATIFTTSLQPAISLGFYGEDCKKNISYLNSIIKPLNMALDKASNPNMLPIDIIVDAGISNIAQLALLASGKPGYLDQRDYMPTDERPNFSDYVWNLNGSTISGWKTILTKFDNIAKSIRKDCIFIADGARPMCLDGDAKIVRPTKPENTVANTIIPLFKYIANAVDSSYSAGYCNWFLQQDYSNNSDYFWIPPSIKMAGVYTYCDTYFHPWSAPAGHTRGLLNDVIDISFTPTDADAGIIYSNSWNYAMSYPMDGIVVEGHKTFQSQRTALDRVNVRRLMLHLEKQVANVAKSFVYEQNTPYMRQTFVDTIRPILEDAVSGNGISEYAIKCDDEINTVEVIENNEMRCKIAVRPIKVVDWILITFICSNQSVNINEEVMR